MTDVEFLESLEARSVDKVYEYLTIIEITRLYQIAGKPLGKTRRKGKTRLLTKYHLMTMIEFGRTQIAERIAHKLNPLPPLNLKAWQAQMETYITPSSWPAYKSLFITQPGDSS